MANKMSHEPDEILTLLTDRGVISVQGEDATEFLQKIVSQNLKPSENKTHLLYSLLLTPQGKVLYDFLLHKWENSWFIECNINFIGEILSSLQRYKLRTKVSIEPEDKLVVGTKMMRGDGAQMQRIQGRIENDVWGVDGELYPDPRSSSLPYRSIVRIDSDHYLGERNSSYVEHLMDLHYQLKLPILGHDFLPGEYFPFDLGLHYFNAISMDKGCYIGQEVITRTLTRGAVRKAVYRLKLVEGSFAADSIPPHIPKESHITHNENVFLFGNGAERAVGKILGIYSATTCLAVLREIGEKKRFRLADGMELVIDE